MNLTSQGIFINFAPIDLIAQYKAYCVRRGLTMKTSLREWVEEVNANPLMLRSMKLTRPRTRRGTFFYIRGMSPETKQMFKVSCRDNQTTMTVAILSHIKEVLDGREF